MLNNQKTPPQEDPIEQLLGSFTPVPVEIDRNQLMFQAGMRAAQAAGAERPSLTLRARTLRARFWPVLAMVSTAAALILAVFAWQRPERIVVVERLVPGQVAANAVPQPPRESVPQPQLTDDEKTPWLDPSMNYVRRRELLLRDGPDALSPPPLAGDVHVSRTIPTQRELLRELPGGFGLQKYQIDSEAWWQTWLNSGERL
jgi:hypothetical protein